MIMKTHYAGMHAAVLAAVGLLVAGCSTPETASGKAKYFQEASQVNAVLEFCSWDYTFLLHPRYEDHGFLKQVRREDLHLVFDQFGGRRDLAVVVVGWTYEQPDVIRLAGEWKSILGGCGFQRVVFLRPNTNGKLNGSLILYDSPASPAAVHAALPHPLAGQ